MYRLSVGKWFCFRGLGDCGVDGAVCFVGGFDPMQWGNSDHMDNRMLQACLLVSNRVFNGMLHFSCSVDKARIFGRGLFDCIAVAPNNVAAWGPPLDLLQNVELGNIQILTLATS